MLFADAIALTELPKRDAMPYSVSPDTTTYVVPDAVPVEACDAGGMLPPPPAGALSTAVLPGITSSWPMNT
jgi:hypothetical protein